MRDDRRFAPRSLGVALVLCAAVVVAFLPVLHAGFVDWDDDLDVTDNVAFRGLDAAHVRWMLTTTLGGHWQPLTWLTYAVDHALWGMEPAGYHLTSLAWHVATTVLVYRFAVGLLPLVAPASPALVRAAAGVAALAFGVHPLRVESVAWVSERRDVVSGFFYVLALLAYVHAATGPRERRRLRLAAAVAALVASLLAKAWGMTLPAVLLVLDAYPLGRFAREKPGAIVAEKTPFAAVALVGGVVAFLATRSVEDVRSVAEHPIGARVAQAAYGLCFYVVKTLVPVRLSPAYLLGSIDPGDAVYVASVAAVVTATLAAMAARRRHPWLLAAWTSYAIVVAPVLGLAQVGPQLVADRYTYLACIPWALVAGGGVLHAWRRRGIASSATAVAGLALAILAVLTYRQSAVWRDSNTLWTHVLRLDPANYVAYTNRGFAESDRDLDAAIADYSEALRINPRWYLAWFDRGNARQTRGDLAGAIADFTAAIAVLPADPKAWNNRGWAKESTGDLSGAEVDYARALELAAPEWRHRQLITDNLRRVRERIAAGAG